jgi:hypothetical protein
MFKTKYHDNCKIKQWQMTYQHYKLQDWRTSIFRYDSNVIPDEKLPKLPSDYPFKNAI